jgi:hypothetical protein
VGPIAAVLDCNRPRLQACWIGCVPRPVAGFLSCWIGCVSRPVAGFLSCWIGCVSRPVVGFLSCSHNLTLALKDESWGFVTPIIWIKTISWPLKARHPQLYDQIYPRLQWVFSIERSGVVLHYIPDSGIYLPIAPAVTCWAIGIRLSCRLDCIDWSFLIEQLSFR